MLSATVSVLGVRIGFSVTLLGAQVSDDAHPATVKGEAARCSDWDEAELEATFGPLVDALLEDEEINLRYLPDGIERVLYLNIVRLLLNIGASIGGQSRLDVFGVAASFSLR
uniref:Uncharacterized protein n=1 Tax=Calcidiscus leptoporus TaxID=127549 RepID=A0A7S0NQQ8_9EUKA